MRRATRLIPAVTFLLLTCITAVAQAKPSDRKGNLSGSVTDLAENAPIKYAFVLVHGKAESANIIVKLDARGRFDVRLAAGLYDVFVAADGFSPACKRLKIVVGKTTVYDAKLQPDSEHLESDVQSWGASSIGTPVV